MGVACELKKGGAGSEIFSCLYLTCYDCSTAATKKEGIMYVLRRVSHRRAMQITLETD